MEYSATQRARQAVGTVCDACGKHFSTSNGYNQHWRSRYLCCTPWPSPCHVGNDGSNRYQIVATTRANVSTALLQKLRLSKHEKAAVQCMEYTF